MIGIGKTTEAISKLDAFSEDDDEFVGAVAVAELYVDLDCFEHAIKWFEREVGKLTGLIGSSSRKKGEV